MAKVVQVLSPGSCGEFIQGVYGGEPCLVSCPVNLYSRITIQEGPAQRMLSDKAVRMLELIFNAYGLPRAEKHRIDITLTSEIPLEKGMASSTADIAGLAAGLNAYYGLGMDSRRLSELCIAIEPTDNTMFRHLNLFNHMAGDILMDFKTELHASVLIIDFAGQINTVVFHNQREGYGVKEKAAFEEVVRQFQTGVTAGNMAAVGAACTESARLNQRILYKPHLETLITLCRRHGGYGVVGGHSGTVIGILYNPERFDYKGFMIDFINQVPEQDYEALYRRRVIPGGITVQQEDAQRR